MKNNKKVFVLASVLLFSGFLLGGNSQVVKAAGENDTASTQTSDSVESSMEGSNVTTSDDGTVSANITYNGVQYSVKGKVGTTVKATPDDGSSTDSINVTISDRSISETTTAKISLDGNSDSYDNAYQEFNDFGQPITGEYENPKQGLPAYQEMKDQNGNVYYKINDGKWIKQGDGVTNGIGEKEDDGFKDVSFKESPYFVINKVIPKNVTYEDPESIDNVEDNDGIITGTFTKRSYKYNQDFEYTFSGKIGESVKAELKNPDDQKFDLSPLKVKIFNDNVTEKVSIGSYIILDGTSSQYYKTYHFDGTRSLISDRVLPGNTGWPVYNEKLDEDGNLFYQVFHQYQNIWIKQESGVDPSGTVNIPVTPSIKIEENKVIANVSIPSNLGNKVASDVPGDVGDDINVTVPPVSGYKADKSTVSAHVNEDGTITTKDSVKYTPIKSNSSSSNNSNSSSSSNTDTVEPEYLKQTVSTFPDKPNVKLYHLNADSMTADDTIALAPNSDWQSDQRVVVKGDTYYRVATNEWVKASQVYIYTAHPIVVETKPNGIKKLASAEGNTVTDRALASDTDWYSDRIAYLNDGTTEYYRVATNEFVKQSDINEITK